MQENRDGKLSPEQESKCKEGNVRGVFGYPTATEELAKKYKITPDKINYILCQYGSMDEYIKAYVENGDRDFESEGVLQDNVRPYILIDLNDETRARRGYSELLQEIFDFESSCTCGEQKKSAENKAVRRNVIFFDGQRIIEALKELNPRYETVIRMRFGLNDGRIYTLKEVAEAIETKFGETARQIEGKAIHRLKYIAKSGKLENSFDAKSLEDCDWLPEEIERINLLLDKIYRSNFIFIPDEEYLQEADNISSLELMQIVSELESIRQAYLQRMGKEVEDVGIEKLGLNPQTYKTLKRNCINTVLELIERLQLDSRYKIRQLGQKGKDEIEGKLEELVRETNIVQKSEDGRWMKRMGSFSIDVPFYMELKRANIVSVEQVRALISLMDVISDIRIMNEEEFSKLVQVIISGENDSEMAFDSGQMDLMRILGTDGLTGIKRMKVIPFFNLKERLAELPRDEEGIEEVAEETRGLASDYGESQLKRLEEEKLRLEEVAEAKKGQVKEVEAELLAIEGNETVVDKE